MKFRIFSAGLALQLLLSGLGFAEKIVIYHTSDVHGQYSSVQKNNQLVGGYPALAALVKKEKRPYILVDSGDVFQGTPEGNVTRGMGSVALMNQLGYSACAVGNHDFDFSETALKRMAGEAKFPFLGANIRLRSGPRVDYAKPYTVVQVGGVKLGIIGVISETTPSETLPDNVAHLSFPNKAKEAAGLVPELKAQGVDAIVVLAHSGLSKQLIRTGISEWTPDDSDLKYGNLSIARAAPGEIAVVFGGHNHTGFSYKDAQSGALFVESYAKMEYTSRVELDIDTGAGKVRSAEASQIQLQVSQTGEDAAALKVLEGIQNEVGAEMDKPIGAAAGSFDRRPAGASSLGNYVADTIREKGGGAEISFINTTELRADIKKGPVTGRAVFSAVPFDNTVYTMDVSGEALYFALKNTIRNGEPGVFVSGIRVEYGVDEEGKAKDVKVYINKVPLDNNMTYKAATTSFIAGGGSIGGMLKQGVSNKKDTGVAVRDAVLAAVKKDSPVRPNSESRFELKK